MATAVLAVQGAFAEHAACLHRLGEEAIEIRQAGDLEHAFDRLVLPGGESTVQAKLLHELGLFEPLRRRIEAGMPVLGTCAGLILLAREVAGDQADAGDLAGRDAKLSECRVGVAPFSTLDVTVRRNAYGRQLGSFHAQGTLWKPGTPAGSRDTAAGSRTVPMTFIRAPRIERIGPGVEVLASLDGHPVAVRQGNQLAAAFHPELDQDLTIHRLFLDL